MGKSREKTFEVAEFMEPLCRAVSAQLGHPCVVYREYQPEWRPYPGADTTRGRPTYVLCIDAPEWQASRFRLGTNTHTVKAAVAMLADVLTFAAADRGTA